MIVIALFRAALEDEKHLGTRAKYPRRNCVRPDGQKFVFYDNFLARSRDPIQQKIAQYHFESYSCQSALFLQGPCGGTIPIQTIYSSPETYLQII